MSTVPDRPSPWQPAVSAALLLEAVAVAAAGLAALGLLATGRGAYPVVAVALSLAALVIAAALVAADRALRRGRARVVAPVVTWQLLQGATAIAVLGAVTPQTPPAVPAIAWAGLGLAALVVALLLSGERARHPKEDRPGSS